MAQNSSYICWLMLEIDEVTHGNSLRGQEMLDFMTRRFYFIFKDATHIFAAFM
jgi:hypothetical protein